MTIAGGITTADEIAALDRLGADAQVGMALYKGQLNLADAFAAALVSDRADTLWPTVVTDEYGKALGLAYSNTASLRKAIAERRGVYHSRTRGLWVKGETSGATQALLRVDADCDRDTLRFTVRQQGVGFCHRDTYTCWGPERGLAALARELRARTREAPRGFIHPAFARRSRATESQVDRRGRRAGRSGRPGSRRRRSRRCDLLRPGRLGAGRRRVDRGRGGARAVGRCR